MTEVIKEINILPTIKNTEILIVRRNSWLEKYMRKVI